MIPVAGWVAPFGYPRIKACSRLPMAFRSVPRPSSPPGTKASTECPYRAPYQNNAPTKSTVRLSPCTGTITPANLTILELTLNPLHSKPSYSAQYLQTPLNTETIHRGTILGEISRATIPSGQTITIDSIGPTHSPPFPGNHRVVPTRPETHQNQIYNTKEQTTHSARAFAQGPIHDPLP